MDLLNLEYSLQNPAKIKVKVSKKKRKSRGSFSHMKRSQKVKHLITLSALKVLHCTCLPQSQV